MNPPILVPFHWEKKKLQVFLFSENQSVLLRNHYCVRGELGVALHIINLGASTSKQCKTAGPLSGYEVTIRKRFQSTLNITGSLV